MLLMKGGKRVLTGTRLLMTGYEAINERGKRVLTGTRVLITRYEDINDGIRGY